MTYAQAKMIVWFPAGCDPEKVNNAALIIIGTLDAEDDDVRQASIMYTTNFNGK